MEQTVWIATVLIAAFGFLGLWHVGMAFRLGAVGTAAVPTVEGKPLFVPSRTSTLAVAVVLFAFAGLIACTAALVRTGLPRFLLTWACYGLALGLAARAVGDFRYVGFFKRVRGSRFARTDTLVFSPLCVLLALGVLHVALTSAA